MDVEDILLIVPVMVHLDGLIMDLLDEEDDEREPVPKIENYAEDVVPRFNDCQFRRHFRILPETFEYLLGKIHIVVPAQGPRGRPQVLIEKQLMLTIWYIANMECFRSVAERFELNKSTAWEAMKRTMEYIIEANFSFKFLAWHGEEQARETAETFENMNGFPGIEGIIDGTHIEIQAPSEHPNSYYNRNKYHSILLQGVCNEKKKFIDVFTGVPGSCHDSRLFEFSDLSQRIRANEIQFPENHHLLGDLAYKLETYMMVGFKDFGNLTLQQKNYNNKLKQLRVYIENTFALLKGRFRRLKKTEAVRMDIIVMQIICGCILHNICMLHDDIPDDIDLDQEVEEIRRNNQNQAIRPFEENIRRQAIRKRNFIVNNLAMHNNV